MRVILTCVVGGLLVSGIVFGQAAAPALKKANVVPRPEITAGIAAKAERLPNNRAHLTLVTRDEGSGNVKLLDWNNREVSLTKAPDGSLRAEIDPARGYVIARPLPPRQALTKEAMQFPARYVTFGPPRGADPGPSPVPTTMPLPSVGATPSLGGLFLRAAVVPLTWDEKSRTYATEIVVGYEFDDGSERVLSPPKTVTFFAEGANARIAEDTVKIERSGVSGFQRVVLATGQFEGETNFIARAGPMDELKGSVAIQREPGALKLSLPSTELAAFGVGSSTLTVTLLGRDGSPLPAPRSLNVQLSSRRLHQPATLILEQGKSTVTADIRSTGFGGDQIVAQSGAFHAELPVRLIFPVAAIVAALAGGALGGSARYLKNKRKRGPLLVRRIMEGMLVGLILVGATWTGLVSVDISTGALGTPFGAFVLAALSGYLGCVVLDRVANKTFGGLKAPA